MSSYRRRAFTESVHFTHILNQLIINDINAPKTLAESKALLIATWLDLSSHGVPVYQCTALPWTTSTDEWATLANQSFGLGSTQEAVRVGVNDWLRDGSPITESTMVGAATGATGGTIIRAGQSGHPLAAADQFGKGYVETADAIESARNSGKLAVPAHTRKVTDAAMTSGSPTLTSATAAFTAADVGLFVRIDGAGPAAANLYRYISAYVSATQVTLDGNASTTVAGAQAIIGAKPYTADGIHPSGDYGTNKGGHQVIADYVAAQFATILGSITS